MPDQRPSLIDAIKNEHAHLNSRLTLLKREIRVWSDGDEPDYDLLQLLMRFFTTFPDEIHHKKEDYIYDALIRNGVLESDYLVRLKSEHEDMRMLTERFSNDLNGFLARRASMKPSSIDNINQYVDMQELHMADEESQFLPLAESLLPEARFVEINEAIQLELITDAVQQSFRTLSEIDAKINDLLTREK